MNIPSLTGTINREFNKCNSLASLIVMSEGRKHDKTHNKYRKAFQKRNASLGKLVIRIGDKLDALEHG